MTYIAREKLHESLSFPLDFRASVWYTRGMDIIEPITGEIEQELEQCVERTVLVPVEEPVYDPSLDVCNRDEESFALAVIEYGGNISAAYKAVFGNGVAFPVAKGRQLLSLPRVALKIKQITDATEDATLISTAAHLNELARIRDIAIVRGETKVALNAEVKRGEAVGIYQQHDKGGGKGGTNAVQININMASQHDVNI